MILAPCGVRMTSSSMRAAETPSVAGQYVSTANTMPALSSIGSRRHRRRAGRGRPWGASGRARDERALVQAKAEAMAEVQAERGHLALEADVLRGRQGARDLVARHARAKQLDRLVHPFARLLVRRALRRGGAADVERAVVARAIAHE